MDPGLITRARPRSTRSRWPRTGPASPGRARRRARHRRPVGPGGPLPPAAGTRRNPARGRCCRAGRRPVMPATGTPAAEARPACTATGLPTVAELAAARSRRCGWSPAAWRRPGCPGPGPGGGRWSWGLPQVPTVSREHARFTFSDGQWWIANLGRNGLTLNGTALVGEQPLQWRRDPLGLEIGRPALQDRYRMTPRPAGAAGLTGRREHPAWGATMSSQTRRDRAAAPLARRGLGWLLSGEGPAFHLVVRAQRVGELPAR